MPLQMRQSVSRGKLSKVLHAPSGLRLGEQLVVVPPPPVQPPPPRPLPPRGGRGHLAHEQEGIKGKSQAAKAPKKKFSWVYQNSDDCCLLSPAPPGGGGGGTVVPFGGGG